MTVYTTKPVLSHEDDFAWSHLTDAPGPKDIRWKAFTGGPDAATQDITFGVCEVPPGGRLRPHYHAAGEVYYVTAGSGDVLLDHEIVQVRPGSVLFIPADLVHGVRNHGSQTLSLMWIFAADHWSDLAYHGAERDF